MTELKDDLPAITARVVAAYVRGNRIALVELPNLISDVHEVLAAVRRGEPFSTPLAAGLGRQPPAVPVSQSVTADYIISLEDGRRLRSLTRHLKAQYGLTPAQYRARWNLPPEYPMVAPNYSRERARIGKIARQKQLARAKGRDRDS